MITATMYYEYFIECDVCGECDVAHTGDLGVDNIRIHNIPTAIKGMGYHRRKGKLICNKCFKNINSK